jgi:hypothetical protein
LSSCSNRIALLDSMINGLLVMVVMIAPDN